MKGGGGGDGGDESDLYDFGDDELAEDEEDSFELSIDQTTQEKGMAGGGRRFDTPAESLDFSTNEFFAGEESDDELDSFDLVESLELP